MPFRTPTLNNPMTTNGDMILQAAGVPARLPVGTAAQVLTVVAGAPAWAAAAGGFVNPMTTNGDLITQAGGVPARVPVGTAGQVLTVVAGAPAWAAAAAGAAKYEFQFSLPGNASGTPGILSKANSTNGNPGGLLATTSAANPGINNGAIDPYIALQALTVTKATLKVAHAAVSQATAGGAMTARFTLYRVDYSTRTSLGDMDFSISTADVFNNLGSDQFQVSTLSGLALALASGDCFGVEFVNRSANNNEINALGGIYLALEAE